MKLDAYSNKQWSDHSWGEDQWQKFVWEVLCRVPTFFLLERLSRFILHQSVQFSCSVVSAWTTAHQASLSITISWSSPKPMSIELVMPSNHLILCCPLLLLPQSLPGSRSFPMSQLFASGGQSTGVSASTSVPPMNTQDWSPLGWTGWISLQSKGRSRVFSQHPSSKSINPSVLSFLYSPTLTSIHDHWKNHSLN